MEKLKTTAKEKIKPLNIGKINEVMWPYVYVTPSIVVVSGSSVSTSVTISQESAFVVTDIKGYMQSGFRQSTPLVDFFGEVYNPYNSFPLPQNGSNVSFIIKDAQSSRIFMNEPIEIGYTMHNEKPFFSTPQFFLPTSTIEVTFFAKTGTTGPNTYMYHIPKLCFIGYRVRVDEAKKILSTVKG